MKINYHAKSNYGTDYYYINDEDTAEAVQKLTGNKTITKQDMQALEQLGHEVNHEPKR